MILSKLPILPVAAVALAVTLIGVIAFSHAQAGSNRDSERHGRKLAEAYCSACHGSDGNSTDQTIPKLAGQDPAYLLAQLRAFKSGARQSDIMSGPVSALSDAQLQELAGYYSRLTARADTVRNPTSADVGADIFNRRGPGAPPCAACHGGNGFGPMGSMMGGGRGMMGGGG
ncbi:MAG TPA: cytochrome c, partial [Micropepsaceae bacterium]|nr:cytochrome c [Micropepsaceae bacterium]